MRKAMMRIGSDVGMWLSDISLGPHRTRRWFGCVRVMRSIPAIASLNYIAVPDTVTTLLCVYCILYCIARPVAAKSILILQLKPALQFAKTGARWTLCKPQLRPNVRPAFPVIAESRSPATSSALLVTSEHEHQGRLLCVTFSSSKHSLI